MDINPAPEPGGDRLLASLRAEPAFLGFFDIADNDESWRRWVERTTRADRARISLPVQSLSISYRKSRDIAAAKHWASVHLRMAQSLPEEYGPGEDVLGLGRDRRIGDALIGLANLEELQGSVERSHHLLLEAERYYDAEENKRRAEGIIGQPHGDRIMSVGSVRASLYQKLARSAVILGQMDLGQHYHNLWVQFRNEFRNAGTELNELRLKAAYFIDQGNPGAALQQLEKAVEIAERENPHGLQQDTRITCLVYQSAARIYASLGTPRRALAMLDKAKALVDELAEPALPAGIEVDTAHVLREFPSLGDPLPHLLRALERHSTQADPSAAADGRIWSTQDGRQMRVTVLDEAFSVLLDIAQILEARGQLGEAADFLSVAADIAGQVRDGALDETGRMAIQDQLSQAYVDLGRIQLLFAGESDNPGPRDKRGMFADAAWLTVEKLRARSFLDTLGDVELIDPVDIDSSMIIRESELLNQRRQLRLSSSRNEAFWNQQEAVRLELSALWDGMAARSPSAAEYAAVRQARPASRAEVANLLSAEGHGRVVVVNMLFPDDNHLALLAVDADSEHVRTSATAVDRKALTEFVATNFGEAGVVRELATDLEEMFHDKLSGVAGAIAALCEPGDTVVICPAAPLHHVPLGAVRVGHDVLLARNPLAFAPSASMMRSRRLSGQPNASSAYAVFGDPSGDLKRARCEAITQASRWHVTPFLGGQATGDALLSALAATRTVHVAAHAFFDADHPLQSSIQMADRQVSARDILGVRAPALDLVTLSACESGIYHAGRSEDPLGLTRALLFAGAKSTLSTLWKVEDEFAGSLMQGFYDNLSAGVPKAEALRRAALAVREKDPRIDRWAAFILTGSWA